MQKIDKRGLSNRKSPGESGFTKVYASYRGRAMRENIVFSLDKNDFRFRTQLPCYYCGEPPSQISTNPTSTKEGTKNSQFIYNGIDRVDPKKGYENGNVLSCCKKCNYAKHIMGITEFLDWIKKVHKNCFGE